MNRGLRTCGELVALDSQLPWVSSLVEEGGGGTLTDLVSGDGEPTIFLRVEADRRPFDVAGWSPLTRGAWARDGHVVLRDVCTSGFDLHVRAHTSPATFTYRWRPPRSTRAAAIALRSRFHLLARAVLLQYPAIWWAGTRGRAPLHASACTAGGARPLLAGPSGVGKSTLLTHELAAGARAASDNLCVGDGTTAWGVVEPLRVEGASGRRMPHGRREAVLDGRVHALEPDRIVVLQRGTQAEATVTAGTPHAAIRSLVTGTYMAGELRRYWAFAATLAAGTGLGPAHAPVMEIATAFGERLPCIEIVLPAQPGTRLAELLDRKEAQACR